MHVYIVKGHYFHLGSQDETEFHVTLQLDHLKQIIPKLADIYDVREEDIGIVEIISDPDYPISLRTDLKEILETALTKVESIQKIEEVRCDELYAYARVPYGIGYYFILSDDENGVNPPLHNLKLSFHELKSGKEIFWHPVIDPLPEIIDFALSLLGGIDIYGNFIDKSSRV